MLSAAAEAGMHDRRHRRPHERDIDRDTGARPNADPLVELQRAAGNRAVAELLVAQRVDARAAVQRQPADGAEAANEGQVKAAGSMTIPELEKTLPIRSFSRQADRTRKGETTSGEAVLEIAAEHLDARIQQALLSGRKLASIVVTIGSLKFTMKAVLISGLQVSKDQATLSLSYESSEMDQEPQREHDERDRGNEYDLAP
jgi:hypothetical protein